MSDPAGPSTAATILLILAALLYAQTASLPAVNDTELHEQPDSTEKRRTERMLARFDSGRGELRLSYLLLMLFSLVLLVTALAAPLGGLLGLDAAWGSVLITALFALLAPLLTCVLPGSIAAQAPAATLRATAVPAELCVTLLSPFTRGAWLLGRLLLSPAHIAPALSADRVTEDEIRQMVDLGEEKGAIEADEKEMIENVFEFNNRTAADCMIHRKDIRALDTDSTDADILSLIRSTGLSRFPVYEGTIDNVIGILTARDFLLDRCSRRPRHWRSLLRDTHFVPESVRADTLFSQMQSRKQHMSIVIDEYGGTSGLITLEDLLEEIVGNIYDEFDPKEEQEIARIDSRRWHVSGSVELELLNDTVGTDFPLDEEYETLGGLVFSRLTEIPSDGATPVVECFGTRISVTELADRRVEWAVVELLTPDTDPVTNDTDKDR